MAANQSDIKDWVQKYLDLGWSPIPIPKGEKGPRISGWENLDFKVEDFDDDANIGVHLGRTLYDVDYDHPYAARAAEGLMPDTPATFGRPSKLRSHGFYIVTDEPITSLQFKDTNETMLVELRGLTQDGQPTQTVVPCSVHKSGERISWAGDYRQALRLPKAALVRGVTLDAIAAILAVHFPEPKARHKPRLALASYLSRLGLTDTEVKYVGLSIMRVIPEGDRQDWENTCASTLAKLRDNPDAHVLAGKTLRQTLTDGDKVFANIDRWLDRADVSELERMNEKYFVVRSGSDVGIADAETDEPIIHSTTDLALLYENKPLVKTGVKKDKQTKLDVPILKSADKAWRQWTSRREHRKIVFAPPPSECDSRDYNTWKGLAVKPDEKDNPESRCGAFLDHIYNVVCDQHEDIYNYVVGRDRQILCEPGRRTESALNMRGEPGVGKGLFAREKILIIGPQHATQLDKTQSVTGRFNKAIANKIYVFMDEAAAELLDMGSLNRIITEPTIFVEPKHVDGYSIANFCNLDFATNLDHAMPIIRGDRRFLSLYVKNKGQVGNRKYFKTIYDEMNAGGREAYLAFLEGWKCPDFDSRNVPQTEEQELQQSMSLTPEVSWLADSVHRDELIAGKKWPISAKTSDLHASYLAFMERQKRKEERMALPVFARSIVSKYLAKASGSGGRTDGNAREHKLRTVDEVRALIFQQTPEDVRKLIDQVVREARIITVTTKSDGTRTIEQPEDQATKLQELPRLDREKLWVEGCEVLAEVYDIDLKDIG